MANNLPKAKAVRCQSQDLKPTLLPSFVKVRKLDEMVIFFK